MFEKYLQPLQEGFTLQVFSDNEFIFGSKRHWLNPLFEFEDWLMQNPIYKDKELSIHDSIQGKAAAILTCRLGIKKVNSDRLSKLALAVYEKNKVESHYSELLDKVLCITEDIITDDMSSEEVYKMLCLRAKR